MITKTPTKLYDLCPWPSGSHTKWAIRMSKKESAKVVEIYV